LILTRDGDRPGQTDRGGEFRLLRTLAQTAIPVPQVYWCDTTGKWLERPFIVMERVGGEVTPTAQLPYPEKPMLRQKMADRFTDILADLHGIDWESLGLDFLEMPAGAPQGFAQAVADGLRDGIQALGIVDSHPTVERGLAWCCEQAPRTRRLAVCHGDYRTENILHADGQILAVIDWERARIGDPMADLGYVCAAHLRVGDLVCGLAEQETVLRRYEERAGEPVERHAVLFWEVNLLLQTVLYFSALRADARQRGGDAGSQIQPLIDHLVNLVGQTLDAAS
jgi:aminoglycoside phosphotransferase (APT) family kinase protein